MNRKQIRTRIASVTLAGLLFSMLLTFIALDVNSVRREAQLHFDNRCGPDAMRACSMQAVLTAANE